MWRGKVAQDMSRCGNCRGVRLVDEPFNDVMGKSNGSQGRGGMNICEQQGGFIPTRVLQMQYSL